MPSRESHGTQKQEIRSPMVPGEAMDQALRLESETSVREEEGENDLEKRIETSDYRSITLTEQNIHNFPQNSDIKQQGPTLPPNHLLPVQSPSRDMPLLLEKRQSSEELRAGESGRRKLFSLSVEKKESNLNAAK